MAEMDEKLDGGLNLALRISKEEMAQSEDLQFGYNSETKRWQIIVKYTGDIKQLEALFPNTEVVELYNQFAVITTEERFIDIIASMPEIEFVEKPKRLYFNLEQGRSVSCVNAVQKRPLFSGFGMAGTIGAGVQLSGKGVLVAIIDSGERVIILSSWQKLAEKCDTFTF